nr:MAG TPA: hypothetical protein [Bacteriophage sp.]
MVVISSNRHEYLRGAYHGYQKAVQLPNRTLSAKGWRRAPVSVVRKTG